jgi:serine/threonine protein phosphatase 1
MSKTYAIADLHGRFDLLEMALAKIADHAEAATVVTLGDYVDRGPDSRQVVERLMGGLDDKGRRLICLKGNHEDIMWQTCRGIVPDCDWWLTNGGSATLISYGQDLGDEADVTVVPDEHLRWIERLPLIHVDQYRIFVHAAVDPNFLLDEQDPQDLMWKIYDDDDEGGYGRRHVVHGHHQHADGPILKKKRTNLDTFAWYIGRLAIGVFDDDTPGGPLEILEVRGQGTTRGDF